MPSARRCSISMSGNSTKRKGTGMKAAIGLVLVALLLIVMGVDSFPKKDHYPLQNCTASQLPEMVRKRMKLPAKDYKVLSNQPFWTEHRAGGHIDVDSKVQYYAVEVQTAGQPYVIGLQLNSAQAEKLADGTLGDLRGNLLTLDAAHTADMAQYASGQTVCAYFLSAESGTELGGTIQGILTLLAGVGCLVLAVILLRKR